MLHTFDSVIFLHYIQQTTYLLDQSACSGTILCPILLMALSEDEESLHTEYSVE